MKTLKLIVVLISCFVILSSSFVASASGLSFEEFTLPDLPTTPYEDMVDVLDPYAASPLADAIHYREWYAGGNFGFNDLILSNEQFLFYEDLPYGENTLVIGAYKEGAATYLMFVDSRDLCDVYQRWNASGLCAITVLSYSPIYRIAYSIKNGSVVSFYSYTGLTNDKNESISSGDLVVYGFAYTFIDGDFNLCLGTNNQNCDVLQTLEENGETLWDDGVYGVAAYPTRSSYENKLQQEQNDKLDEIINATGDSTLTTLPDEALNDFNEAESDLVDDYDPSGLGNDLSFNVDSSAVEFIWHIIDMLMSTDVSVLYLFGTVLSLGIVALILGR